MVTIVFPKTEADYESISFQVQSPSHNARFLTAQLKKRDGGSDKANKIFYDYLPVDSAHPVLFEALSPAISVLNKKNPGCIAIDRTNGIVSVTIQKMD